MKTLAMTLLIAGTLVPGVALAQSGTMMTSAHARSAMTDFGCSGITQMGVTPDGSYHAQCQKGGNTINVMMDKAGMVSTEQTLNHVSEGRARYAMTDFGCSNISQLGVGPNGSWHGQCYKGGAPVNVMVDNTGVASLTTPTHVTEGMARSLLTDFGCSNISSLEMAMSNAWVGQCSKGGALKNVMIGGDAKVTTD